MKCCLSIITPVYQGVTYIKGCMQAVIEQNAPYIEHIIVDGGSSDGTVEIIEEFAKKYTHIRWISEKDRGQSHAMNKGIRMARGEIINFLNADDYYEPHTLTRVLSYFDRLKEPALLVGNCIIRDESGGVVKLNTPSELNRVRLLLGEVEFPYNPSAYFYHRSLHNLIGLYDENEHYMMDIDFILRALKVANLLYVNETWGNHVRVSGAKTVELIKNGLHTEHMQKLLTVHIQQLVGFENLQYETRQFFRRHIPKIYYYSTNNRKILPAIKRKIRSVIR